MKNNLKLVFTVVFLGLVSALGACDSATFSPPSEPQPVTPAPDLSNLEVSAPNADELIFSSVKGTSSDSKTITLKNIGDAPLDLEALALAGADAEAFTLSVPGLPAQIEPGGSLEAAITFVPGSAGSKSAQVQIVSGSVQAPGIGLYGLGSEGEQGEKEPPLQQIVDTLGYSVDVGGSDLRLGSGDAPIGDEVLAPLFVKAGSEQVKLEVVARYDPEEQLTYGFFTLNAAQPVRKHVGLISAPETQKLLPILTSGSVNFDPGDVPFGIYGRAGGRIHFSLDGLNTGSITHALRVYPMVDRDGVRIPNAFLIGLEEAENGDYQDVLFAVHNVRIAQTAAPAAQSLR